MSHKQKDVVREAKNKIARFCAYRERAPLEVRNKLGGYGLSEEVIEKILEDLASNGFLNENRFAISYANGKLRLKKWGKLRIRMGLERYKIDPGCIIRALEAIPNDEYRAILKQLVEKKWGYLNISDSYIRKHKVAKFVISKGFEPDLVWEALKELRAES